MPLDTKRLTNQSTKFLKSLKKLQEDDAPERVHKIRTRIRRLEATLSALEPRSRRVKKLLATLKPMRRLAGKVRDMDVFTPSTARYDFPGESEVSIQLLESLGAERARQAAKLQRTARKLSPETKKGFRYWNRMVRKALDPRNRDQGDHWPANAAVRALELEAQLREWPALTRDNLHPFRKKAKELRYVLQLGADSRSEFTEKLGDVKDAIGEWHDWQELALFADTAIAHPHRKLLKELHLESSRLLKRALVVANRLRTDYLLNEHPGPNKKKSAPRASIIATAAANALVA